MTTFKTPVTVAGIYLATSFACSAASIDLTTMQLNGNASVSGTAVQLTEAVNSQRGSAFTTAATPINASTTFSAEFEFMISGDGSGADGLTFVVQNSPDGANALGGFGGGIGYLGIANSLTVEFDTWNNGSIDNNSSNHVGINLNGDTDSVALAEAPFTLEGAGSRFAWIEYDGTTLDVFLSENAVKPGAALLSHVLGLGDLGSQAYFGFTAATGGARSNHTVNSFDLEVNTTTPVPLPASLPLAAFGMAALFGLGRRRNRR